MIPDSSAIIAILGREPECDLLVDQLLAAKSKAVSAATLLETDIVLVARFRKPSQPLLDKFLEEFDVMVAPFTEDHWKAANQAFLRFGKGRHPAALNFGDCISYATARLAEEPLLFIGQDFTKTDLSRAEGGSR
ncbi:MAG TPA: type II toxin-antitoxin system VapC family toxin [Thermoanaerobaculia bacterium]|jgi:ribonuclease VapC|nr:type II toxin-antitoxin system VapC family toxin [Thermoanaerobaculia bacterium]